MCLSNLSNLIKNTYKNQKFGWKVFTLDKKGRLLGDCLRYNTERPMEKWLNEKDFRTFWNKKTIKEEGYDEYPTGWHIFLTKSGATNWCLINECSVIRKVRFRKPVAWGSQGHKPIVVAKEIFIEKGN